MANKRLRISEAAAVNEIGLQDLLDLSSKVVNSVLGLQNGSLKFTDKKLMSLATKLNSEASAFHNYISTLVMQSAHGGSNFDDEEEDTKMDLNKPESGERRLESAMKKYLRRKALKEEEKKYGESDEQESEDENSEDIVIDLTEPFSKVVDTLDDNEFSTFKKDVVGKLEAEINSVENKLSSEKADEFAKSVEALDSVDSADDFDFAMDNIYDFADDNSILIETVKRNKKKVLKEGADYEYSNKDFDKFFDELVPSSGHAETVEGEMIRVINKIIYRYTNDGDFYFRGYGKEVLGDMVQWLLKSSVGSQIKGLITSFTAKTRMLQKQARNKYGDYPQQYTQQDPYYTGFGQVADIIVNYVENQKGNYTPFRN